MALTLDTVATEAQTRINNLTGNETLLELVQLLLLGRKLGLTVTPVEDAIEVLENSVGSSESITDLSVFGATQESSSGGADVQNYYDWIDSLPAGAAIDYVDFTASNESLPSGLNSIRLISNSYFYLFYRQTSLLSSSTKVKDIEPLLQSPVPDNIKRIYNVDYVLDSGTSIYYQSLIVTDDRVYYNIDNTYKVWDRNTETEIATFSGNPLYSAAVDKTTNTVYMVRNDNLYNLRVYYHLSTDTTTIRNFTLTGTTDDITDPDLFFAVDGKLVFVKYLTGSTNEVWVFDIATQSLIVKNTYSVSGAFRRDYSTYDYTLDKFFTLSPDDDITRLVFDPATNNFVTDSSDFGIWNGRIAGATNSALPITHYNDRLGFDVSSNEDVQIFFEAIYHTATMESAGGFQKFIKLGNAL